jgi:hypothetical protein
MHYAVKLLENFKCTDDVCVDQNLNYRLIPWRVSCVQILFAIISAKLIVVDFSI